MPCNLKEGVVRPILMNLLLELVILDSNLLHREDNGESDDAATAESPG